ncbi:MAG: sigma-70 family RNA polymerase sigma factor, partial [Cetobacterium sp.]
ERHKNLNIAMQGEEYSEIQEFIKYTNPSLSYYTPEETIVVKEFRKFFQIYLKENLSPLEKKVFLNMAKGYNYNEIANILDKESKSVDNSIQRIKKKVDIFLKKYNKS